MQGWKEVQVVYKSIESGTKGGGVEGGGWPNTSVLPGNVSGAARWICKVARNIVPIEHARVFADELLTSKTLLFFGDYLYILIWSPRACGSEVAFLGRGELEAGRVEEGVSRDLKIQRVALKRPKRNDGRCRQR